MSERQTPITPEDPDIPDEAPRDIDGGDTELRDEPLGVPVDLDEEDAELPGLPEREPPQDA